MAESTETTHDAQGKLRWYQFGLSTLLWLMTVCAVLSSLGACWWRKSQPVYRTLDEWEEMILKEYVYMDRVSMTVDRRPTMPGMYFSHGQFIGNLGRTHRCSFRLKNGTRLHNLVLPAVKDVFWVVMFVERDDGKVDYFVFKCIVTDDRPAKEPTAPKPRPQQWEQLGEPSYLLEHETTPSNPGH